MIKNIFQSYKSSCIQVYNIDDVFFFHENILFALPSTEFIHNQAQTCKTLGAVTIFVWCKYRTLLANEALHDRV